MLILELLIYFWSFPFQKMHEGVVILVEMAQFVRFNVKSQLAFQFIDAEVALQDACHVP